MFPAAFGALKPLNSEVKMAKAARKTHLIRHKRLLTVFLNLIVKLKIKAMPNMLGVDHFL